MRLCLSIILSVQGTVALAPWLCFADESCSLHMACNRRRLVDKRFPEQRLTSG
jgi:hypothetical protein